MDAAANKIGISAKNWARKCLLSVDMWRMGPIISWFASGFVMSSPIAKMLVRERMEKCPQIANVDAAERPIIF